VQIRRATLDDIGDMAALASRAQADGARHIGYLGLDAESIRSDVDGVDDWADRTAVAVEAGRVVGWLVAERDDEMGRVWWWGPFVDAADWQGVADRLYELARTLVPVSEEELAPDDRHRAAAEFASRSGFRPETASAVLWYAGPPFGAGDGCVALGTGHRQAVAVLHDRLFPGTHTTGRSLVGAEDPRLVVVDGDRVMGYVAGEIHSDGSGYIDYLGVDPEFQRSGFGRRLVQGMSDQLLAAGAHSVHLTVRESNAAARSLYASLGFTHERLIRPWRKGFTLDS
jgi:ribosomal protein S18 acetylase RimI-like enzyme